MRVAVSSLLYRKVLRLSQSAIGETSTGKMVNLLTNDVSRFDFVTFFANALWILPLQIVAIGFLMWLEIGFVCLIGIAVIIIVVSMFSKY